MIPVIIAVASLGALLFLLFAGVIAWQVGRRVFDPNHHDDEPSTLDAAIAELKSVNPIERKPVERKKEPIDEALAEIKRRYYAKRKANEHAETIEEIYELIGEGE